MSKQHVLDIIHTAQGRAAAIDATAPGFAFNKALSVEGYHASIDEARNEVFQYIALQSRLNAQRGRMLAAGRALAERSSRMLCAVHSTFGKDSHQYQAAAAVKSSAPRRKSRKRRGAAVATGSRAAKSMPGRSTAQRPVEEIHAVAGEGLVGKDLADVGWKGDAGTEPRGVLGVEMESARRIEALPPREIQEGAASPADAVERGEGIDGAGKVAEEDVAAPKPKALAIDADDARRAGVEAFTVAAPFHENAHEDGNDEGPDLDQHRLDVAGIAEDEGEQDGKERGDAPGHGEVHAVGGGSDNGSGQGQAEREGSGVANAPVCHGRGGVPRRGCGWDGVRQAETRKRAAQAVSWAIPEPILEE